MDEKKSEGVSLLKLLVSVLGLLALILCTVVATLLISNSLGTARLDCAPVNVESPSAPPLQFSRQTEWTPVETLKVQEKGVKVVRTYTTDRCYIMPLQKEEETDIARPLVLIPHILTEDLIVQIAGEDAVDFCEEQDTYLLRDPEQALIRRKRQAPWLPGSPAQGAAGQYARQPSGPVNQPAFLNSPEAELEFGRGGAPKQGERGWRPSGLDFPYEQRVPRCMDLVLDCGKPGAVGQVQQCFTWVNGVIKMAQRCVAPNKFEIFMTKPPGRILKIAQKQWILCLQRRRKGLRC